MVTSGVTQSYAANEELQVTFMDYDAEAAVI